MQRIAATLLVPCLFVPATAQACFFDQKVVSVNTGRVELHLGPDGGDAVYFKLENGTTYALNNAYNLDHPRGQALHRVLLLAQAGGYPISGWDHFGGQCDDIDEIQIVP